MNLTTYEKCRWMKDQYHLYFGGAYDSGCGEEHQFQQGELEDSGYKYCPYCGKEIEEITE